MRRNLTAAAEVHVLEPHWNPAVEDQAADRAHRLGQARPVTVRGRRAPLGGRGWGWGRGDGGRTEGL